MNRKVVILIGSLTGGGAERVVLGLSKYLNGRGYPVCVVTMHGDERDFFRLDPEVQRIGLGLASSNRGFRKVRANYERIQALRRIIRTEQAGVVIGMMTTSAVLAIIACMGLDAKAIACERNYPGRKVIERSWRILRRVVYPFAAAHVAQTNECAEWLAKKTHARNVRKIPNAVSWPLAETEPRIDPASVLGEQRRLVVSAGSKSHQKGFDLLLRAFACVARERDDWDLAILGLEGPSDPTCEQREVLRRQAEVLGIEERTYFPGRVGNMVDWYERADIFVLSSRYEGFPNALLEAMAAGCASVSFDCDTGPRDIVEHRVNGLLVPPEDWKALASAIMTLVKDEPLRDRLSSNAISVRENFSEQRILSRWDDTLRELTA